MLTRTSAIGLLVMGAAGCSQSYVAPPRPAQGCLGPQLGVYVAHLVQEVEEGGTCVRLDLVAADGADDIPEVTAIGPLALSRAYRVSSSCVGLVIPDMRSAPSATAAHRGSGEIETTELFVSHAAVELEFGAAPDGSQGPSTIAISAADVDVSERCALDP